MTTEKIVLLTFLISSVGLFMYCVTKVVKIMFFSEEAPYKYPYVTVKIMLCVYLLIAIACIIIVLTCNSRKCYTYTLSVLKDDRLTTDIRTCENWNIRYKGKTEDINLHPHQTGDTLEIVHTDSTVTKYLITAIKP